MLVNDIKNNRGTHGDSSFMLDGLPSSSENPPTLAVGSVNRLFWILWIITLLVKIGEEY